MATTQKQKTVSGGSVAGSSSESIPGSIVFDVCSFGGRKNHRIIWRFSISLAA